ncbi:nuclear transport factor 2 family protein [Pyxidicoccus fallax]|uniref:Nuclear transport factor 2 family protein n=1 Tax=Pyxidicoccus fallax TaxID=394095 RepID=A0A848LJ20_9BACT|nr:nuclear transport factor 2 family protein [Pyxidicoccus fallax]NMO17704.1 nuclear transport factor 2 family protein [Pyxidicoccus fallax]NPC82593.1 nuclear transport factor 2 family protein [Pyxidicoccus fallax]
MLRPLLAACAAVLLTAPATLAQQPQKPQQSPPAQQPPAQQQAPAAQTTSPPATRKAAGERTQAALQQVPPAKPEDVRTIAGLTAALYDVISGPAGQPRDWQRFRSLFYPGAQMIPVRRAKAGEGPGISPFSFNDYATWGDEFFKKHAFFEKETHRQVAGYGDIVNVLSAYETRETANGPVTSKGVNSLQLAFDGQRWWVLSLTWMDEKAAGIPVPKDFTRKE